MLLVKYPLSCNYDIKLISFTVVFCFPCFLLLSKNYVEIMFWFQNLVPEVLPKPELKWDYNLGDIVLGMPVISEVCESEGVRLVDRLPVIVTHALCHLIGHRHGNDTQWSKVSLILFAVESF